MKIRASIKRSVNSLASLLINYQVSAALFLGSNEPEEFWNDTVLDNQPAYFIGNFVAYEDGWCAPDARSRRSAAAEDDHVDFSAR